MSALLLRRTALSLGHKYDSLVFLTISFFVNLKSQNYQQALTYGGSLFKESQDLTTVIATKSDSGIYVILNRLLAQGVSSQLISVTIGILLLYLFQSKMSKIFLLFGFKKLPSLTLAIFCTFTYTFVTPFAYEVQITGPVTMARLTPIIVLTLMCLLLDSKAKNNSIKTLVLLIFAIWAHLIIGIFLLNFVIFTEIVKRKRSNYLLALLFLNLISIAKGLISTSTRQSEKMNELLEKYGPFLFSNNFCLHYSNLENVFLENQLSSFLKNGIFYVLMLCLIFISLQYSKNRHLMQKIGLFYVYSLIVSLILSLISLSHTETGLTTLSLMPLRFLDLANTFAFPILVYLVYQIRKNKSISLILIILIGARIANARFLQFYFKENEVHFITILLILSFILISKRYLPPKHLIGLPTNLELVYRIISTVFIASFLFIQILHSTNSQETDWRSISNLKNVPNFMGSKLLTSQEVSFPMAVFDNFEVLGHGEIQSVMYAPEQFQYVDSMLKKYYGTDLALYFKGNSCSLQPNATTKELWESWESYDWLKSAKVDGFRFVIVPDSWNLNLERVALIHLRNIGVSESKVSVYKVH